MPASEVLLLLKTQVTVAKPEAYTEGSHLTISHAYIARAFT